MYVYKKEQQQDNNTKQTKRYDDVAAVRFYCILKSVKQKKTIRKTQQPSKEAHCRRGAFALVGRLCRRSNLIIKTHGKFQK